MPLSMYELQADRRTITLELPGGNLVVTYRPNQLTPARELAIIRQARDDVAASDAEDKNASEIAAELETAEYNISRQIANFVELVEAWDFTGPLAQASDGSRLDIPRDHMGELEAQAYAESRGGKVLVPSGHVVPIRQEFLRLMPSNFLMNISARINDDMRPNPKKRPN